MIVHEPVNLFTLPKAVSLLNFIHRLRNCSNDCIFSKYTGLDRKRLGCTRPVWPLPVSSVFILDTAAGPSESTEHADNFQRLTESCRSRPVTKTAWFHHSGSVTRGPQLFHSNSHISLMLEGSSCGVRAASSS